MKPIFMKPIFIKPIFIKPTLLAFLFLASLLLTGNGSARAAAYAIPQSSGTIPLVFQLVSSADHISDLTGATVTVTISKAGAAYGSPAGAVTEVGSGTYKAAGNSADTSALGPLILRAVGFVPTPSGAPTVTTSATGGTTPAGAYLAAYSWVNAAGETQISPTASVTTTGTTSTITLTGATAPQTATGINVYLSTVGGGAGTLSRAGSSTTNTLTLASVAAGVAVPGANTAQSSDPNQTIYEIVAYNPQDASLLGLTGVATATTQGTQGTTLAAVNANASTLLLSLATYQSTLTTGSTTTALNTALTGTADLTGGKVVFTAGINKGVTRTITSMNSTTGVITLLSAVPNTPGATDAFSVVQGSKVLEQFLAALGTDSRPVLSANAQPSIGITNALPALDGSNRVLLQPVQTGVTIPTVTTVGTLTANSDKTGYTAAASNLPADYQQRAVAVTLPAAPAGYGGSTGDTSGVTTLLTRLPAALSFTGANVNANAATVADKTGYSGTATNFTAAPTTGQIASAILLTPANLLATNASNQVTTSNPAASGSTVTEATIWGYATRALTDKAGFTATASNFVAAPTPAQNAAAITFPATVAVNNFPATVVASNLPADYQQRAVAVTLPTTAPTGYGAGAGGGTAQTGDLYALLNPLVSAGKFTAPALSLAPATALPTDFLSTAEQISLTAAATGTPSAIVAAMKADTLLAKVFNRAKQAYTYNLTTHVITLLNDDGTTMGTVTLTIDPTTNTITSKQ